MGLVAGGNVIGASVTTGAGAWVVLVVVLLEQATRPSRPVMMMAGFIGFSLVVLKFHPGVTPGVCDSAYDARTASAAVSDISGGGDPAERPQVGAATAESFFVDGDRVTDEQFDGFFVGDVVQAVDLEHFEDGASAAESSRALLAGFRVGGSEVQRELDDVHS